MRTESGLEFFFFDGEGLGRGWPAKSLKGLKRLKWLKQLIVRILRHKIYNAVRTGNLMPETPYHQLLESFQHFHRFTLSSLLPASPVQPRAFCKSPDPEKA